VRFVDEVELEVRSGRGGRGSPSFRREKYVPNGGPDGGDGGKGGDVVLRAAAGLATLLDLKHQTQLTAGNGAHGEYRQRTGAAGEDLLIRVPVGTIVTEVDTGNVLFELTQDGEERVLVAGGKGGLGNVHFKTSTNRAPRQTGPGEPGRAMRVRLELRLMADVGLLGFPNAGKSTLVSVVSAARPRIADYPFTTLVPHLGVVSRGDEGSFVVADIPGLIEGAAEGKGLGHQFLRHVERTRLLLHLISLADESDGDVVHRWRVLRDELRRYDTALTDRPEVVVLSKADAVEPEVAQAASDALVAAGVARPWIISAVTGAGVESLVGHVWTRLREEPSALAAPRL